MFHENRCSQRNRHAIRSRNHDDAHQSHLGHLQKRFINSTLQETKATKEEGATLKRIRVAQKCVLLCGFFSFSIKKKWRKKNKQKKSKKKETESTMERVFFFFFFEWEAPFLLARQTRRHKKDPLSR